MTFWNFIEGEEAVELRIEGDIVDDDNIWIYEWFDMKATAPNKFRNELKKYSGKDITVWIDSYGGNVYAGASIYNALKEHKGKITVKIDGKAMSAASVIAMAGDEIHMSPLAVMMIHNPLTRVYGNQHELRKTADVLDEIKDAIINAYTSKTGRNKEEISVMMDDETWMSANTAVKEGFADYILYENEPLNVQNIKGFNFNRLAVVNSASASIEQAIKLLKRREKNSTDNPDKDTDDPENTTDDPKNSTNDPKNTTDDPDNTAEQPKSLQSQLQLNYLGRKRYE